MPLILRTLKVLFATVIAIWLAQFFKLSYATSAGVIAMLSLLDTRRSSFSVGMQRLASVVLAILTAYLVYMFIGYSLIAIILYLVIYIPLAYTLKLESGVVLSTVLVFHLLQEKSIDVHWLVNEFCLFGIGVGVALLVNMYMPSYQKEIDAYHLKVEQMLQIILIKFSNFLKSGNGTNDAALIIELSQTLDRALDVVYLDRHNQLFQRTNYEVHYFEMRKEQNKILKQIAQKMNVLHFESEESLMLSYLFQRTAYQLSEKNPAKSLLDNIEQFLASFRKRALPATREEFEARATLFQILHDLERFIQCKVDFYEVYKNQV